MNTNLSSKTVYLKDYKAPTYYIHKTNLRFELFDEYTDVTTTLELQRNGEGSVTEPLKLNGEALELLEIHVDGKPLSTEQYYLDAEHLILLQPSKSFSLKTRVRIKPQENTSLEGLYKSRTMYCTQCEAEGFRKITYYLDRPDVMSDFTTTIVADKTQFPILLSNGNLKQQGDEENGRHFATWHDPFKKPCYLFALVAGDLSCITDSFTTASGRSVTLKIYVEAKDIDKCDHAMASLKHAMRWDEKIYGREYDLDIFMIVAVDDFNMGAMENKGLNIFNTSCVLAKPETTTDQGYQRVEAVVAHEYFHNWSGNRVTCRDWFQLSLKEGFTVYRDSEFSADMGSRVVKRVEDVALLRTFQFAEDAGPMAHAVRPASFMEISNFYTLTIYEKGCELVRMLAGLLGPKLFRKGTDLYFDRHDAQAVTTDDFVAAMEDVSGRDFTQFKRWYSQAGTPVLRVTEHYSASDLCYTLIIQQATPATPESAEKLPFHIPVAISLLGNKGALSFEYNGVTGTSCVLELTENEQKFTFNQVMQKPVPSLLQGFSAPVKLHFNYTRTQLANRMQHDNDEFNRWEAGQVLALAILDDAIKAYENNTLATFVVDALYLDACKATVKNTELDLALVALMLTLPAEKYIAEQYAEVNIEAIHYAHQCVSVQIATELSAEFLKIFSVPALHKTYSPDAQSIAARSLKNTALHYLMLDPNEATLALCQAQFSSANNMTDQAAALTALVNCNLPEARLPAESALADFYQRWHDESLVVNQWLAIQAKNPATGTLARVQALLEHEAYDANNPNKIRALIGGFCNFNAINFHAGTKDNASAGYAFLADQVLALDKKNPQIAARLLTPLVSWQRYSKVRQAAMQAQLNRIASTPNLSKDVLEVVTKSLVV